MQIKKYLHSKDKSELIELIINLSKQIPQVNRYFKVHLDEDEAKKVIDNYKKQIKKEFFPSRGFGKARVSIARQPIDECKRITPDSEMLIELMFYYVGQGVRFTLEYGDIDEPFYISMETMYERALELAKKLSILDDYQKVAQGLVVSTCGMGWGFHDQLSEINYSFYKTKCPKCGY